MRFGKYGYSKFIVIWLLPVVATILVGLNIPGLSHALYVILGFYFLYIAGIITPLFNSRKSIRAFESIMHRAEMYVGSREVIEEAKGMVDIVDGTIDMQKANAEARSRVYLTRYDEICSELRRYSDYYEQEAKGLDRLLHKLDTAKQ